jgi:hypothetical protein
MFLWHFSSLCHGLRVIRDFYRCKMRPEVVLSAWWSHRQFWCHQSISRHRFSTGGLWMFFVWQVPLKSYSTFSAVISNLAVNLHLKQTAVSLTHVMTPTLSCTLCTLPRRAIWTIKRRDMFILCRDTPVNFEVGNLQWRPKNDGFFGDYSSNGWQVSMRPPKGTSLAGTESIGV